MSLATLLLPSRGRGILARRRVPKAASQAAAQVRRIRVNEGYDPQEIRVKARRPIRLIFRREESATCSERVVLPDFGINAALPPFEEVAIDLPGSEPGEHEFTCHMQMMQGRLVIEDAQP